MTQSSALTPPHLPDTERSRTTSGTSDPRTLKPHECCASIAAVWARSEHAALVAFVERILTAS